MRKITLSAKTQALELKRLKEEFPEFKEVNAQVLSDVIERRYRAYQAFFRRLKLGQKAGFPRFKSRDRYHSCTFRQDGFRLHESDKRVFLSKIGHVKIRAWCSLPTEPASATVTKKADGWYVTFVCTNIPAKPLPLTGASVGIDLGLTKFITTSENETIGDINLLKKAEKNLRETQRSVSSKKKGSNRRKKAKKHLSCAHLHLTRVRKAQFDIITKDLVQRFDVICAEKLDVAEMVSIKKNKEKSAPNFINKTGLRRNIGLASWAQFISILSYKAEEAGKKLILVNPRGTSQECSGCGKVVKKDLTVRVHECPHCGILLDRDHNAAINILQRGLRLLQEGSPPAAGKEDSCDVQLSLAA